MLNFNNVSGLTTIQGGLNNANQDVRAHSIGWFYDAVHNQTLVYANAGRSSLAQSSASLMLVDLVGGNFHLSAQPNGLAGRSRSIRTTSRDGSCRFLLTKTHLDEPPMPDEAGERFLEN